jgi:hypothetical protein
MNCDDYLAMLETLPVGELAYGRAREHALCCRDCDRVTRVVAERERNMLLAYGALHPSAPARQTTAGALATSGRRRVVGYYRVGLGVTAMVTVAAMALSRRVMPPAPVIVSETFQLRCLSDEQAGELLRPVMKATGRVSIRSTASRTIVRVEATPAEMSRARSVLDRYENAPQPHCGRR